MNDFEGLMLGLGDVGRHACHRVYEDKIFPGLVVIINQICLDGVFFKLMDKYILD